MAWYLWVFLSMVANSFQTIIDKASVLKKPEKIDVLSAMFYRNLTFFVATVILGLLGVFGKMSFVFNIPFLILAVVWPLNSYLYDYSLRNIEVSRFSGIYYTLPFLFLFVDKVFFKASYAFPQILGVCLLVIGAILFTLHADPKEGKKAALSKKEVAFMIIRMIPQAGLLILYKVYSSSVNQISYYFSLWVLVIGVYLVFIIATRKYKKLYETARTHSFLAKTFIAKSFDAISSVFYLEALGVASLTAVSSLNSFSPLVILIFLVATSHVLKIHIAEDFSRRTLGLKIVATLTLIAGGVCMFLV